MIDSKNRKYSKGLIEWVEYPISDIQMYTIVINSWSPSHASLAERPWVPEETQQVERLSQAGVLNLSAEGLPNRRHGTVPAPAVIEKICGNTAICLVHVAGTELPVEIPFNVLKYHGFKIGDRFLWWMSKDGSIQPNDIDDLAPISLTAEEEEEAENLYNSLYENDDNENAWEMSPIQDR